MSKIRSFLGWFLLVCFAFAGLGVISPQTVSAQPSSAAQNQVVIYLFWGDGCSHCAVAKPFLSELAERYPHVELRAYEVWNVAENQELFTQMAAAYGFEPSGVPTILIGDRYWVGYNDTIAQEIEAMVQSCESNACPDRGVGIIPGVESHTAEEPVTATEQAEDPSSSSQPVILTLPLLGQVHLEAQSIWISTALIAFVDGFNPCSLWVLSMLLALTIHTASRKKVLVIGLIFLTVTAAIYALFIAGLFSVLKLVSFLGWVQVIVALVALFFGLVNIKDYFWYQEGISFTIAKDKKAGIFKRIRAVMDASQSLWGLASATVVLAAGVSVVEFSCTAGFPVLWVNLLNTQNVGTAAFVLLLLLYMLIYQIDELAIFSSAVVSLKASRLEEKHGRLLKLIGGMLMLTLAGVMLINPSLMNDLGHSLLIFGVALLASLVVLLIHRILLPRLGIQIGNEPGKAKSSKTGHRRH